MQDQQPAIPRSDCLHYRWTLIPGSDYLYLLYQLAVVSWPYKVALVFSFLPFILFFGKTAWLQLRMDGRRLLRWINMRR